MNWKNKNILFATDMSDDCREAYSYALSLAAAFQGKMTLLHVIESHPVSLEKRIKKLFGDERYEEIMQEHEQRAQTTLTGKRKRADLYKIALSKLSDECRSIRADGQLPDDEILIKHGDVVEEIMSTAKEKKSDIILLTAHASSPDEAFISKNMQEIMKLSRIPVMVVPASGIVQM